LDFSTDSEKEDEPVTNNENKEANVNENSENTESDSEMELIVKSLNEDQGMQDLMKNGIQRLRKFMEKNNKKLDPKSSKSKTNTFLNKKRKHEN
jgi:hypothetical protein